MSYQFNSITLLYHYILNPKQTILTHKGRSIWKSTVIVLALVAFSAIDLWRPGLVFQEMFIMLITAIWIIMGSLFFDFVAQICGYQGQSLKLFQWLSLAWIPLLLMPALNLIQTGVQVPGFYFLILCLCLGLHFVTIKHLYGASNLASVVILLSPLLAFFSLLFLLSLSAGAILGSLLMMGA